LAHLSSASQADLAKHFLQTADITLSAPANPGESNFDPIGRANYNTFTGTYDGAGFSIRGLTLSLTTPPYGGLIAEANGATLVGINLVDVEISSTHDNTYTGGLIGYASTVTISASSVSGNITGTDYVGGLVGHSDGMVVTNSYAMGTITGRDYVGGIFGDTDTSTFEEVAFVGTVNGTAYDVGGLIGEATNAVIR
jgi:hypothetical protein